MPRLFVYHAERVSGPGELNDTFKEMERKLLKLIINPASIAVWVFGIVLALTPGVIDWSEIWVYAKAALVVAMTWYYHLLARWQAAFAEDRNRHTGWFSSMEWAMFCSSTVLPVRGGETIRQRWPLPIGATRSMIRADLSLMAGSSISILNRWSG